MDIADRLCPASALWVGSIRSRQHKLYKQRKSMTPGIAAEDWIAHHTRFAPRSEAAHDLTSGRRFTYAAFDDRISRAALWLRHAFGVSRGDRVAVLSMN